jgi:hypothetical protein
MKIIHWVRMDVSINFASLKAEAVFHNKNRSIQVLIALWQIVRKNQKV